MALIYNGTNVANVVFNGTTLDKVIFNGVTVWESWVYHSGSIYPVTIASSGSNILGSIYVGNYSGISNFKVKKISFTAYLRNSDSYAQQLSITIEIIIGGVWTEVTRDQHGVGATSNSWFTATYEPTVAVETTGIRYKINVKHTFSSASGSVTQWYAKE